MKEKVHEDLEKNGVKIRIRPMEISDASSVYEIEKECFTDPWAKMVFENFKDERGQHFFVAESDSVLGYGTVMTVLDECEILRIAVGMAARRKGIGENLLNEMMDFAKNNGSRLFYLEVRESNTAAINLYKKAGFIESGRRKEYYTNPKEDAVLMSRI